MGWVLKRLSEAISASGGVAFRSRFAVTVAAVGRHRGRVVEPLAGPEVDLLFELLDLPLALLDLAIALLDGPLEHGVDRGPLLIGPLELLVDLLAGIEALLVDLLLGGLDRVLADRVGVEPDAHPDDARGDESADDRLGAVDRRRGRDDAAVGRVERDGFGGRDGGAFRACGHGTPPVPLAAPGIVSRRTW